MADDNRESGKPLSSEELARDEWREEPAILQEQDASGHTLPASESDVGDDDGRRGGSSPIAGTILPPD